MHISNVMLVCPNCGKPTRVAHSCLQDDGDARCASCKKCDEVIDDKR